MIDRIRMVILISSVSPLAGRKGAHTMAYVPVPKDLTKVKTKVALNLTKRQLIFFSLAAGSIK